MLVFVQNKQFIQQLEHENGIMTELSRILVVDDDLTNLRYLIEVLEEDFDIRSVTTGEEALKVIGQFNPQLILLDVMLPGIDGYDVCRQIRSNSELSDVKIILISAKAMKNERNKGYEAGADFYITKPFAHDDLLATIGALNI
jgi:DNA-binding response OmpR family regulator